jgi:transcriptional regulator with XRE-family HTH domain
VAKQPIKLKHLKRLKQFGLNLRGIRRAKDTTQEQLADDARVSPNTINTIEKGKLNPTFATICSIADALKAHPRDLMDF